MWMLVTAIEAAKKRLDAAKKYVDIGKDIRQLDNVWIC